MKIGFPNNPKHYIEKEITWIGNNGFDYLDLYLEEGNNSPEKINTEEISNLIKEYNMVVAAGHTPWYLPIGSPIKTVRNAAAEECKRYIEKFAELDVRKIAVHANWSGGAFTLKDLINFQSETLNNIVEEAKKYKISIVFELTDTKYDSPENLKMILENVDGLKFLLDIGHANLNNRKPKDYITLLGAYLGHIHIHDNFKDLDLHLPIGCGNINWDETIQALKKVYDGTITLEIFSRNKEYVLSSREKLLYYWHKK